ncbi:hypothetical protein ACIQ7D_00855 [Streptomyces sp. NPDC096310]|uniref:hypothetical protein n=1 Tax=Streptomyces sp. NPDC096310 TaxID=3366082 RepID=UPI003812D02E
MARAPQRPALWSAGGTAVHETTELYDPKAFTTPGAVGRAWERLFAIQLDKIREKEPNENLWRRSAGEDIETWQRIGLGFVQSYISWRERSPWEIWTTPTREPAIER